ncbi:RING finger protein 207-like isoform X2 [Planococcus citri]|uniref:RING finger protein 207-like isoform X2 n=1 Tax=Planococcus citri TaxID=170843 RepID=UPI0031F7FB58
MEATFDRSKMENEKPRYFPGNTRKPLICCLCEDYYSNPCLLSCYHSFCSRCLENRWDNGVIHCPLCGTQTECEGNAPPTDLLLKKLVELFDMDNPPCANCDKRERSSMFFCSTCNQALCGICRENTHRAKMFSSHEISPTSKFSQEGLKKCPIHGEPYVMYLVSQKIMLCVNCFRDLPAESRQHCIDVDTAYTQSVMKLESVITAVCETQNSVRDGIILCRSQLDELLHNTDAEKMTVHSFTQGLQDAINKTQSTILLEVQRQYEMKERSFRNQLVSLSTVLPILQQHILLCQSFSSTANKFQFLEVVFSMIDRLNTVANLPRLLRPTLSSQIKTNYRSEFAHCLEPWVGRLLASSVQQTHESVYETALPTKLSNSQIIHPMTGTPSQKQQSALKMKALEGDGPFSNHCRSFNSQVKELGTMMKNIKDRLGDLRKDVTVLHRSATPPLVLRHQVISQDCARLNDTLEQIQVELERLKTVFQSIWQEQLYRIHVEQDIFHQQMTDVVSLRGEVKQLSVAAKNLEPYVSQLTSCGDSEEIAKLKSLLSEISQLKDPQRLRYEKEAKFSKGLSRKHCQSTVSLSAETKSLAGEEPKRDSCLRGERAHSISEHKSNRGVFSQLIDKVRSKEKTAAAESFKERSKSEDRLKECTNQSCQKVYAACSEGSVRVKPKRISSLYNNYATYKSCGSAKEVFPRNQKSEENERNEQFSPNFLPSGEPNKDPEKYAEFRWKETTIFKGAEKKESDYQSISEATSIFHSRNNRCYSSDEEDFCPAEKRLMKPTKKSAPPSPPPRTRRHRRYPHSDTEESVFYRDTTTRSLPTSAKMKDRKAIFLVIGSSKNKMEKQVQKQRSWETFPPKKKIEEISSLYYNKNPDNYKSQFDIVTLESDTVKKSDSFEGHEEAVSSLVREFQKIRMLQKQKQNSQSSCDKENM